MLQKNMIKFMKPFCGWGKSAELIRGGKNRVYENVP